MAGTLLVFGHGYSAAALSRRLVPAGWQVLGTTRRAENLADLEAMGVSGLVWPGSDMSAALAQADHVLISTAPDEAGDPVLLALGKDIAARASRLRWVGYLSTTAVYGDHGGDWVDETTPLAPATRRGRWRVAAETAWQELAVECGLPLHIFRLAGIYGPGRGPFAKVRAGTARRIIKSGQVFSRIHVEDIARVLEASMAHPVAGAVYNVCDDEAAPPEDVIALAAELLGLPLPQAVAYEDAEMTPMARSFYAESKRVRNDRLKSELGVKLEFPDYRSGLRDLLARETG